MFETIRYLILRRKEHNGRLLGSQSIKFDDKTIAVAGEDIIVKAGFVYTLFSASAFYLPLPSETFGIVTFPDGEVHNLAGGLHLALPGLYKLNYVDKRERSLVIPKISETTNDGKKVDLQIIISYRIIDPIKVLQFDRPINSLINYVKLDLSTYIRIQKYSDLINAFKMGFYSSFINSFNSQMEISKSLQITNIELIEGNIEKEEFTSDEFSPSKIGELIRELEGRIKSALEQDAPTENRPPWKDIAGLFFSVILAGVGVNLITPNLPDNIRLILGILILFLVVIGNFLLSKRTSK